MPTLTHRIEHDLLGDREVPASAYYGVHTLRALENFAISGTPISRYPHLINALASIKEAAAITNSALLLLPRQKATAIEFACQRIRRGEMHEQFVVDVIQGGAGTSTNMNANEVIANLALEKMGFSRGEYGAMHPNEDVNLGQSTNDVYPTALKIAMCVGVRDLVDAIVVLRSSFERKSMEFKSDLKMGRTQLQDAVPMTLGQEFAAFASMLRADEERLLDALTDLRQINLGATAIGTGINTPPEYAPMVCRNLSEITGLALETAPDLIAATQDVGAFVLVSGVLKRFAVKLSKICNDLRLLASGPRAGFGEINLPAMQAGSSIMPGKVNPVIPEVVNQIAFEAIGNDVTVTLAAEGGQLQLNAFEPIIAHCIFTTIEHLRVGCQTLASKCVNDISVNRNRLEQIVGESIGIATALNPYIGYANATSVAMEALASGRSVAAVVLEKGLLNDAQLEKILQPDNLTRPREIVPIW